MKKIWVLRYNDGTADVWDEEKGPPSWPYVDAFDVEGALKELHSDYTALLARHNALREAVAWVKECELVRHYVIFDALEVCALKEITRSIFAARAEVDRLIARGEE